MRNYLQKQIDGEDILQTILKGLDIMTKRHYLQQPDAIPHVKFGEIYAVLINFNHAMELSKLINYPLNLRDECCLYFYGLDVKIDQTLNDGNVLYEISDKSNN